MTISCFAGRHTGRDADDCSADLSEGLLEAIVRFDDRTLPIAETSRRVGREAERLGLPRPSYERVRELVHTMRRIRRGPSTGSVLVDIAFRVRPPEALVDHLSGVGALDLTRRPRSAK